MFYIMKTCSQFAQGTFPTTGWAYKCRDFPLLCCKRNIVNDIFLIITKTHMIESNIILSDLNVLLSLLFRAIQQIPDSFGADKRIYHFAKHLTRFCKRLINSDSHEQKDQKCNQADFVRSQQHRAGNNNKAKTNTHNIVGNGNGQPR